MIKLLSVNNMRQADNNTINSGTPATTLMLRAADGVFKAVKWYGRIGIFSGGGNNGGDGYALAYLLKKNNYNVEVIRVSDKISDTSMHFYNLIKNSVKITSWADYDKQSQYNIIVDCMLGTGTHSEPYGEYLEAIQYINSTNSDNSSYNAMSLLNNTNYIIMNNTKGDNRDSSVNNGNDSKVDNRFSSLNNSNDSKVDNRINTLSKVNDTIINNTINNRSIDSLNNGNDITRPIIISMDINSGLNADNGKAMNNAIKSDITFSIGDVKQGLVYADALDYIGCLANIDIGIDAQSEIFLMEKSDFKPLFNTRVRNTNKGHYKKAGVMGGSIEYSGAIKLSNLAIASLLCGVGLSALIVDENIKDSVMPYIVDSVLRVLPTDFKDEDIDIVIEGLDSISIGMGWGKGDKRLSILKHILSSYKNTLIIDADALNILEGRDDLLKNTQCKIILTPHPKEFSRLSGYKVEEILNNPYEIAKEYARKYNVILLLKGASVIITDGTTTYVTSSGSAAMAKGGFGDVLSGIIAALTAKSEDTLLSVAAASYIAGHAANLCLKCVNEHSLLPSMTIEYIPQAIDDIINS